MNHILVEFQDKKLPLAVRIFLIKLILNRSNIFGMYSQHWFEYLINYCCDKENGGKGFHYFLRDVCTTLIDWCAKEP